MNKPTLVFPCKYDFDLMRKTKTGSFCEHCNKTLKDFSQLSDKQFKQELSTINENTCGRFRRDQITFNSTTFILPAYRAISLSILSLLGASALPNQLNAQVQNQTQQVSNISSALSKLKFPLTIKGTLKERDGRMPITYSKVIFRQKGKTRKSTYTDAEGNFSITLKRTDVVDTNFQLLLSQVGYNNATIDKSLNNVKEELLIKMDISIAVVDYAIPLKDPDTGVIVMREQDEKVLQSQQLEIKNTTIIINPEKLTRKERRKLKKNLSSKNKN